MQFDSQFDKLVVQVFGSDDQDWEPLQWTCAQENSVISVWRPRHVAFSRGNPLQWHLGKSTSSWMIHAEHMARVGVWGFLWSRYRSTQLVPNSLASTSEGSFWSLSDQYRPSTDFSRHDVMLGWHTPKGWRGIPQVQVSPCLSNHEISNISDFRSCTNRTDRKSARS